MTTLIFRNDRDRWSWNHAPNSKNFHLQVLILPCQPSSPSTKETFLSSLFIKVTKNNDLLVSKIVFKVEFRFKLSTKLMHSTFSESIGDFNRTLVLGKSYNMHDTDPVLSIEKICLIISEFAFIMLQILWPWMEPVWEIRLEKNKAKGGEFGANQKENSDTFLFKI